MPVSQAARPRTVCVPKISSMSRDQVVFADQTAEVGLPSYAVRIKIDRFG
jgi:hypothetical protein